MRRPSGLVRPSVVAATFDENAENIDPATRDGRPASLSGTTASGQDWSGMRDGRAGAAWKPTPRALSDDVLAPTTNSPTRSGSIALDSPARREAEDLSGRLRSLMQAFGSADREVSSCSSNQAESASAASPGSRDPGEVTFRESVTGELRASAPVGREPTRAPARREVAEVPAARAVAGSPAGATRPSTSHLSSPDSVLEGATDSGENIKVMIRVRPCLTQEATAGAKVCVRVTSKHDLSVAAHPFPHTFSFDHVSNEATSQERIFKLAGKPLVQNALQGYNSTVFAYGQTGSGKTYTMLGPSLEGPDRGLIPRVFQHLFACIEERERAGSKFSVKCSYVEVYNEQVHDLLSDSPGNLPLREDVRRGVYVEGLTEHPTASTSDVMALLEAGSHTRRMASTRANAESSRSHAVFTCVVEQRVQQGGLSHVLTSRLNLVDLAGSERQRDTGAAGEQLREACTINRSLSALGHVIMALVEVSKGRPRHVPYRDSKLSFLLQDSLGGNSRTVVIACVAPSLAHVGETLSTLKFAANAKCIRNCAIVNEEQGEDPATLRREIMRLKAELRAARQGYHNLPQTPPSNVWASGGHLGTLRQSTRSPGQPDALAPSSPGAADRALVAALRREAEALGRLRGSEEGVRRLQELVAAKDRELQQCRMVIKLREERIQRMDMKMHSGYARRSPTASPVKSGGAPDLASREVQALHAEIERLKDDVLRHPELLRLHAENQQLSQDLSSLEGFVKEGEREQLLADIDELRGRLEAVVADRDRLHRQAGGKAEVEGEAEGRALAQRCEALELEVQALRHELEERSYQLADASSQRMKAEALTAAAERREQELGEELEGKEVAMMETQSLLAETQEQLRQAREQIGAGTDRGARLAGELEKAKAALEEARREVDASRQAAEEAAETAAEAEAEAASLKRRIVVLEEEAQATEADWDDLRQRLEMRERELVEAAAAVQEALERAQDGAAGQAAWELRVASLEQQAEEERQRADGHERAAREAADRAASERAALEARLREVEARCESLTAELRSKRESLANATEHCRRAREEATRATEAANAERRAGEEARAATAEVETRRTQLADALAVAEARVAEAARSAEAARQEAAQLRDRHSMAMDAARADFEARLESLRASKDEESSSVSRTFEHQVRSLKERIAAMVAERQEATTRAQGEKDLLAQRCADLEARVAELGREGQALREAVEAARRERDAEVAEATRALEQRARDAESAAAAAMRDAKEAREAQRPCEGCKRVAEMERRVHDAEEEKRVEVEAMRFSLAQESRRLHEAIVKGREYKNKLIDLHQRFCAGTVPASPMSQAPKTPPAAEFSFRSSFGDEVRKSSEKRDALLSKVAELERKLHELAAAAEKDSPGTLRHRVVNAM